MKNKTVRKALSVLCVLALMTSLSAAVFAEGNVAGNVVSIYVPTSTNDGNQSARSMRPPSSRDDHDLSESNYDGDFSGIIQTVYTNYWFKCSSNNDIFVKVYTNQPCTVTLFDRNDDNIEVTYPVPARETTAIHFYNLNSSHGYYFGFTNDADYASVNTMWGDFTVSHSNPNL